MAANSHRAYEEIRQQIIDGNHRVGDHLVESELAETIGVSRTPVREALRRLATEGLVDFIPNRGARVAEWSDRELDEIFELRALLESYGARLAAVRIQPVDIEHLGELATHMEEVGSGRRPQFEKVALLNNEFHTTIIESAGNRQLLSFLSSLMHVPLIHRTFARYTPEALQRSFVHHRELIAALEQADGGWAESAMRAHILAARRVLAKPDDGSPDGADR